MARDECCCCLDFELEEPTALDVELCEPQLEWGVDEYVRVVTSDADPYDGPYEATPTRETQTFQTGGKLMTAAFVVNPIPSNYGLVEWTGAVLRVS